MAVTESEDFLNLTVKEVEEWIASDQIVVKSEEDVFTVILRWTEKNAQRKQSFFEMFRHLRCVYMSRNYLVTVILKHQLVKSKEQCLDLVFHAMKEVSDGTEACFLNRSPRNCLKTQEDAIFACGGDNTLCYIPSENKWYKMPGPHFKRNSFALATSACQGKLYVVGGNTSGYAVESYYPLLNVWGSIKSFTQAIKFAAAITFQGSLFVIGGVVEDKKHVATVQKYNPDTNLWQEIPPLSSGRYGVCAVADENYMYAIGGMGLSGESKNILDLAEKFDPEVNTWYKISPTQAKRRHATGVSLNSKIFVFGGVDLSGGCPCEMYHKVTNVWTEIESAVALRFPTSAVCFKGKIFVCGRFMSNSVDAKEITLQVYDVDNNEWKPCQNISLGSHFFRLSVVRIPKEVLESCEEFAKSYGFMQSTLH